MEPEIQATYQAQKDQVEPTSDGKSHIGYVIFCAVGFMFLFVAFSQCQGLASELYSQLGFESLGQLCVFTIYICFAASNFVATNVKSKISHKTGLFMGAFGYALLSAAGAFASYCGQEDLKDGLCGSTFIYTTSIASSAILGLGAALLWLSQASYVTDCSTPENLGSMNGVFWSISMSAFLTGAILSTFVLGYTNHFVFYMMMLTLLVISLIIFTCLPKAPKSQFKTSDDNVKSLGQNFRDFLNTFKFKRMQPLFYSMAVSGLILAGYINLLPAVVQSTLTTTDVQEVNKLTGISLIALGVGECTGGYIFGKMIDKMQKRSLLLINVSIALAGAGTTLLAFFIDNYPLTIVAGYFWGTADVTNQTLNSSVIASDFNGKLEGFTMFRFLQAGFVVVGTTFCLLMNHVSLVYPLSTLIGFLLIGLLGMSRYQSPKKENVESVQGLVENQTEN